MAGRPGIFCSSEHDSCPKQRLQDKRAYWVCVGQPCVPGGVLAIPLHVEKIPSPLPNWRCFPIRWVPVEDANVRAAGGGTGPAGGRARISIQMEISTPSAKGGGGASRGGSAFICGFIYLFLKTSLGLALSLLVESCFSLSD